MFRYHGCVGKKEKDFINGRSAWVIHFEDGKTEFAFNLGIALMLCDGRLKRA